MTSLVHSAICFHFHQKIEINFVVWLLMVSAIIYMINSFLVLGLLVHVTPPVFFSRILRSEALVYKLYFCQNSRSPEFFDIRFSYKHYNFSRVCLLVKMALKTLTRSMSNGF